MQYRIAFTMFFTILISACNNNATTQNPDVQTTKIQTEKLYQEFQGGEAKIQQHPKTQNTKLPGQQKPPITNEVKVGEIISLDSIKSISSFENELKEISVVEDCGGFLAQEESEYESILQYGNMAVNVMNDQAVVSKVIGFPDNFKFNYKGLVVDSNFTSKDLNYDDFEIFKNELNSSQEIIGIEFTDIETVYDTLFSLRENNSDDLFYLYFLDEKAVALEIVVQC
ncbi:hypothetical protein ACTXMH_11655 [Psychrobacter celer]|uniref:hypothetical protein n=1 Tax=unclassified Psychrobacter TaxID=196806 RepID=UPI0009470719|nr:MULTISPECIES: hypothetical protein [unclassified Psychrobacter]OLF41332.1 hypothetical protein BTV99_04605 [Psychrobacter sp. Rd 27.2]PJX25006.1 hypothetical protein CAP50_05475 [Psychrobacter sp. L7]